jgi:hypothetical protein
LISVLPPANRLIVVDRLAAPNALEKCCPIFGVIWRKEDADGLPNDCI